MIDELGMDHLRGVLRGLRLAGLADYRIMDPVEWVEAIRRIPGAHSIGVRLTFNYAPYQREPFMEAFNPRVHELALMLFSRGGKTEICHNVLGYTIHQRPRRVGVMWPTIGLAEKWSKDDLMGSLIDPTPELAALVSNDSGRRKSSSTILHKMYPGGILDIIGANAPGDIRRLKAALLWADEIDAIQEISSDEGDQLAQFKKRGAEFTDTIELYTSYPSIRRRSRIEAKLNDSDRRQWLTTCPICGGEGIILHRTGIDPFNDGLARTKLVYDADKPQEARLICPRKGCLLTDEQRYAMMMGGDPKNPQFDLWKPTQEFTGKRGYHAGSLLWPHKLNPEKWPGGYLQMLAQEEINAANSDNPERTRRTLVNMSDGETYEPPCDAKPEHTKLFSRREDYNPTKELPAGVLWIGFGCDVQGASLNPKNKAEEGGRLEVEIIGFGLKRQTWGLGYHVINGSPLVPPHEGVWAELARIIETSSFPHPSGKPLKISGGLVDRGWKPDFVLAFTRGRARHGIYASRGATDLSKPIVRDRPSWEGNPRAKVWEIGTNEAKDIIYQQLERDNSEAEGFMHYPRMGCYSEQYFKGLVAEDSDMQRARDGKYYRAFHCEDGVRNEPLDIRVMATALVRILKPNLTKLAEELRVKEPGEPPAPPSPPPTPKPNRNPFIKTLRPGGGFVSAWRR